jgi:hypothetical protein
VRLHRNKALTELFLLTGTLFGLRGLHQIAVGGNLVQHARSSVAGVPNDTISSHWTVVCVGGAGIIQCGVVDLWKVEEGLDRREDCERIVAAARAGGRDHVGCIILGRGEDERRVWQWLGIAAAVPGFIGFAVGRTVFWDPLIAWRSKKATREETVAEIAKRYHEFVDLFERASIALPS